MQKPWYDAYQVFAKPLLIETMEKRLILDRNIPSDWLSKWHRMLCSLFSVDSLNSLSFHFRTHMYKYGHVWAQRGWYAWCLFVLWSAHPWPPGTLAASPSAGCGECVLSDLLFTKEAAREARWSHLHPSRLFNFLELTNSSVRKQQKPVHDPDLALPVCWCNFLLGRRPMNQRCLTIYP